MRTAAATRKRGENVRQGISNRTNETGGKRKSRGKCDRKERERERRKGETKGGQGRGQREQERAIRDRKREGVETEQRGGKGNRCHLNNTLHLNASADKRNGPATRNILLRAIIFSPAN